MSCGCENRERMKKLEKVRELALKAARLTGEAQAIVEKDGVYNFLPLSQIKDEEIKEFIIL